MPKWRIRLGVEAKRDFTIILADTRKMFGDRQVDVYAATLNGALTALEDGPAIPGSAARDEISPGLRTLHVARQRRRGRHFVMYRARAGEVIEIVRILHDAMDMARHMPKTTASDDEE